MEQLSQFDGSELINVVERQVIQMMNQFLPNLDCCHCSICLNDVAALTIRQMPIMYVTNVMDYQPSADSVDKAQLRRKILAATDRVNKNPHH